jgi:hypothetical protein
MSDEHDAAPAQPGQAVTPIAMVIFSLNPDGTFGMELPEDEKTGRFLCHKGNDEMNRYYANKLMAVQLQRMQQDAQVRGMLGEDAAKITRKLRGLKR